MDTKILFLLAIIYNSFMVAVTHRSYRYRTSGSVCRDNSSICWRYRSWCTNRLWSWGRRNCKKTCGLCPKTRPKPSPKPRPTSRCADAADYQHLCATWKRANFCRRSAYKDSMRHYCAKTCGYCRTISVVRPTPRPTSRPRPSSRRTPRPTSRPTPRPTTRACGRDKPSILSRIVGGNDALPHQWEWQGGLYYQDFLGNPSFVCGGSLIERNVFLTAAHCVDKRTDERKMLVRLGDHDRKKKENGEQDMKVKKIIIHNGWDSSTNANDIAILQLERNVDITDTVGTVCLAKTDPTNAPYCVITGWGKTGAFESASTVLQEARLPLLSNKDCIKRNRRISSTMVCGGFTKVNSVVSGCMGDSGGPFVCKSNGKWALHGVVSWGSKTCDAKHLHTVLTRVSAYSNWIEATLRSL